MDLCGYPTIVAKCGQISAFLTYLTENYQNAPSDSQFASGELMCLPTAREINPVPQDLDGRCAEMHFLGKNLEEAEALFRENSMTYQEDLMFMGVAGFRFYVQAAINYIRSASAAGDSDMINCFAGILESRLIYEPEELRPVAQQLASICAYIIEHYERFDVGPEFYGDLRPRLRAFEQQLLQQSAAES
jgi:hypothetical protein